MILNVYSDLMINFFSVSFQVTPVNQLLNEIIVYEMFTADIDFKQ